MDPVKGLSALLETLRRRFDAIEKASGTATKGLKKARRTQTPPQTLQSALTKRLQQLSKDDPERTEKASTIIVSEALVSRFGEEALNDPDFINMIDTIKKVFIAEPAIREKVERFLDSL